MRSDESPTGASEGRRSSDPSTVWWSRRLFWEWIAANGAAFVIIVLGGAWMLTLTSDVAVDLMSNRKRVAILLIALGAAVFYGIVLGRLQWQVLRRRMPTLPKREWLVATTIPAAVAFALVIAPEALNDVVGGSDPFNVFKDAFAQAFVLGPLIGVAQASALQGQTPRWKWWFVGNVTSWLFGAMTTELAARLLGEIASYPADDTSVAVSPAFPLLAIAFHGVWMLWITAPAAVSEAERAPQPLADDSSPPS